MRPEYFYATLNGSAAEMLRCDLEQVFRGSNYTFNCTLGLPRIYSCSQGQTYTYDPNSLSVLISYESGKTTETQTLTANLTSITIRQGIRTSYDITQEGIAKIKQRLYRTVEIARSLMDWYKSCMEMAKLIGFLSLIATVATAIYGATKLDIFKGGTMTGKELGQTVSAVGQIGSSFMNAWMNYCKMVSQLYMLDMKIQEIEIQMIQMEMCMERQQHELDIGRCDKREESCFNMMVDCIKFSQIRSSMQDINSIMSESASDAQRMGRAFDELGRALDKVGWWVGGYGSLQMHSNGVPTNECCFYKTKWRENVCEESKIKFITTVTVDSYCGSGRFLFVELGGKSLSLNKEYETSVIGKNLFDDKSHEAKVYCDNNVNSRLDPGEELNNMKLSVTLQKANEIGEKKECTCIK